MRRLVAFENITLDGFFADESGGLSWAHRGGDNADFDAFVRDNAKGGETLLLGRVTYEMMAGFWPSAQAAAMNPVVAERMNAMHKVVVSRTVHAPEWRNTSVLSGDLADGVRQLKQDGDGGLTVLGSGSIVSQLAVAGLVDEFQLVVNPAILGRGRTLFDGVHASIPLSLVSSRSFANGNLLMTYEQAKRPA